MLRSMDCAVCRAAGMRRRDRAQTFQPGPKSQRNGPRRKSLEMRPWERRPAIRAPPHHASIALSAGGSLGGGFSSPLLNRAGAGTAAWFLRCPSRKILAISATVPLGTATVSRTRLASGRGQSSLRGRGRPHRRPARRSRATVTIDPPRFQAFRPWNAGPPSVISPIGRFPRTSPGSRFVRAISLLDRFNFARDNGRLTTDNGHIGFVSQNRRLVVNLLKFRYCIKRCALEVRRRLIVLGFSAVIFTMAGVVDLGQENLRRRDGGCRGRRRRPPRRRDVLPRGLGRSERGRAEQVLQTDIGRVECAARAFDADVDELVNSPGHHSFVRKLVPPVSVSLGPDLERQPGRRLVGVGIGDFPQSTPHLVDPLYLLLDDLADCRPRPLFISGRQPRQGQLGQAPRERLALCPPPRSRYRSCSRRSNVISIVINAFFQSNDARTGPATSAYERRIRLERNTLTTVRSSVMSTACLPISRTILKASADSQS